MATFYVAKTGNDGNDGSEGSPWLTIIFAGGQMSAADTLIIKVGTYVESLENLFPSGSGSFATATIVKANIGDTVTIQPSGDVRCYGETSSANNKSYIIIQDIDFDGVNITTEKENIKITEGANHIRVTGGTNKRAQAHGILITTTGAVSGNEVLNCDFNTFGQFTPSTFTPHGVYNQSRGTIVDGNTIHNAFESGFGIHNFDLDSKGSIYRNNKIFSDGGQLIDGILVNEATGTVEIYNNLLYDLGDGIDIARGTRNAVGTKIYNNTIDNCTVGIRTSQGSTGTTTDVEIKNNIVTGSIHATEGWGVDIKTGSTGTVLDSNVLYNNTAGSLRDNGASTTNTNEINTDPNYLDEVDDDYHLAEGGSAEDAGVSLAIVTIDLDGNTRPQGAAYDIGAYERVIGGGGGIGLSAEKVIGFIA